MDDLREYRIVTVAENAADGCTLIARRYVDRKPWICYGDQCGGQRWPPERKVCGYCGTPREDAEL